MSGFKTRPRGHDTHRFGSQHLWIFSLEKPRTWFWPAPLEGGIGQTVGPEIGEADLFERGDWPRVLEGAMGLPSVGALAAQKTALLRQAAGISCPGAWLPA